MTSSQKLVFTCLVLWLAGFLLYLSAIWFDFINYDDRTILLGHPNLYNENSFLASLYEILVGYLPREEPLLVRDISWALDAWIFGFRNPVGYHLGNVLINACNVVLLFLFLLHLTKRKRVSLIVTIGFAVHPIHTQAVCWIMGRKDLLVSFFMLSMLLIQTLLLAESDTARRRRLYLLTLLFYPLAILSKFNAVLFFLVLAIQRLFYPYLEQSRADDTAIDWHYIKHQVLWPMAPYLLISLAFYLWYNNHLREFGVLGIRGPNFGSLDHLGILAQYTPIVVALYLRHLFVPTQLSIDYSWPSVALPMGTAEIALAISTAFVLALLFLYCLRKRKDWLCYLLWFFALMLPYFNLVYIGIWRADRYVYLAMFAIAVPIVSGLVNWVDGKPKRWRITAQLLGSLLITYWTGHTLIYQQVFQTNHTLWKYETSLSHPSMLAYQALAKSCVKQAKKSPDGPQKEALFSQAEALIEKGVATYQARGYVDQDTYFTYEFGMLSKLYYLKGQIGNGRGRPLEEQLAQYLKAYEISSENSLNQMMLAQTYYNLAMQNEGIKKKDYIERSFRFFVEYIHFTHRDPIKLSQSYVMLVKNYERRFDFLSSRITKLKEQYYQ